MTEIEQHIKHVEGMYHAPGTTDAYKIGARQWERFCARYAIPTHQYTEANIIRFLAWLDMTIKGGIGASTAKNKIYAIKEYAYQEHQHYLRVDRTNANALSRFRKSLGIKKPPTNGSDPITRRICLKLITQIQQQPGLQQWEKQTQKTLMILAFSEIKRGEEYIQSKRNQRGLHHGDLAIRTDPETQKEYMIWTRQTGKTHRQGSAANPLQSVIVCKCEKWGPTMCPLHETMKLIRMKQENEIDTSPTAALLIRKSKTGAMIPYNPYTAGDLLKRMAKAAGLDKEATKQAIYTLHGFRKGGAMQAVQDGLATSTIMKQADWKTARMVAHYNRQIPTEMHAQNMINKYF